MSAGVPPGRRNEWPWTALPSAAPTDDDAMRVAASGVNAAAREVARLTEALSGALERLQEAQLESRLTAQCHAAREAGRVIQRARQGLA